MPGGQLHIGWSQIEITPPKKTLLQGQFYARLADTAISPLTATALAVETRTPDDSLEQAIFLSCDLAAEDFKSDLRAKLAGRCLGVRHQQAHHQCYPHAQCAARTLRDVRGARG